MYIIYNNGFHFDIFMSVLNIFTLSIILSLPFPSPSISQLVLLVLSSLWVCVCLGVHVCACVYERGMGVHVSVCTHMCTCICQPWPSLLLFTGKQWFVHRKISTTPVAISLQKISLPPFTQLGNCEVPVSKLFNNWMLMNQPCEDFFLQAITSGYMFKGCDLLRIQCSILLPFSWIKKKEHIKIIFNLYFTDN